jgi:hypothetical protein
VRESTKQGHLVLFSRFHTEFDSVTSWQKRNFKSANDGWEEWDYSQGRRERLQKELVDMEGDPEYIWGGGDFGKPPLKSTKKRKKCRVGDGLY